MEYPKNLLYFATTICLRKEILSLQNMRFRVQNTILFLSLALLSFPASAQRTMSGQSSLCISALYNGSSVCADVFYEQYTLGGFWQAGLEGKLYHARISTGDTLDYIHTVVSSGYMCRVAGTRNRLLNLYMGGRIFLGVEMTDPWNRLPEYWDTGLADYKFLYGLTPAVAVEIFISNHCAFTLGLALPVNFSSPISNVHYEAGLGLKVLL